MKKIGVMLAVLIALSFLLTGCGLLNPVKDTVWVSTDYANSYTYKYTLSFAKDTVSMKIDVTLAGTVSKSDTLTGTYEYILGEVNGTIDGISFTATVEKNKLFTNLYGRNGRLMTFTKQK